MLGGFVVSHKSPCDIQVLKVYWGVKSEEGGAGMDWFPDPMKPLSEKSAAELATEAWLYDEMMGGDDEHGSGGGPSKPPSVPPSGGGSSSGCFWGVMVGVLVILILLFVFCKHKMHIIAE